jgi:cyclopropane-fatty-acyl-phospholipid synthase
MGLMKLEQSQLAYRVDFVLYGASVLGLGLYLGLGAPRSYGPTAAAFALIGLAAWTVIEYIFHRFILHGLQPFRGWHDEHHQRPRARICTPTVFSASLILVLVFLPAWAIGSEWSACAVTLGVLSGYFSYAVLHHAAHHWRSDNEWLKRRKRWHALHHHSNEPACFGVTSSFWDRVFGSRACRSAPS